MPKSDHYDIVLLISSVVQVYSKPSSSRDINVWFYKITPHGGNSEVPVIKSIYPDSHVILNTRHPRPSVKSMKKVHDAIREAFSAKLGYWWNHFTTTPCYRVNLNLNIFFAQLLISHNIKFYDQIPEPRPCEKILAKPFGMFSPWRNFGMGSFSTAEIAAFQHGFSLTVFLADRESHDSIILYEDFVKDPK